MSPLFRRPVALVLGGYVAAMAANYFVSTLLVGVGPSFFAPGEAANSYRAAALPAQLAGLAAASILYALAGRVRLATLVAASFVLMGAGVAVNGAAPSFAAVGPAAQYGLMAGRILVTMGAVAAGGAVPLFLITAAPPHRRGTVFGMLIAISALFDANAVFAAKDVARVDSPHATLIWRGVLVAVGLALAIATPALRRGLADPAPFAPPPDETRPSLPRAAITGFAALFGFSLAGLVGLMAGPQHSGTMPYTAAVLWEGVGSVAIAAGALAAGVLMDRFGRKPVYLVAGPIFALIVLPLTVAFGQNTDAAAFAVAGTYVVLLCLLGSVFRLMILEVLPARHRAGLLALLLTLSESMVMWWNSHPGRVIYVYEMLLAGLILVLGLWLPSYFPETAPGKESAAA
jgi:hypothetical protein